MMERNMKHAIWFLLLSLFITAPVWATAQHASKNLAVNVSQNASKTLAVHVSQIASSVLPTTVTAPVALLIVTTSLLPDGQASMGYSTAIAAIGGDTPYTFSVAPGSTLPGGLNFSTSGSLAGTPTDGGTFSFTLQVSDAEIPPAIATKLFSLQIGHTSILTWSTSQGAAGYNVYRGTMSGGPYINLTPGTINALDYNDTSVQASTNYFYVVTALDSSGLESTYSNEVSAAIPAP
jgi:hypothetical protein